MMVEPLSARVAMLGAGACSCGVKTPLIHFHEPTCLYRRISDAADEVEVLEDRETDLEARAKAAESSLAAANAEIERLRPFEEELRKIADTLGEPDDPFAAWESLEAERAERATLTARVAELEAGLKPFATISQKLQSSAIDMGDKVKLHLHSYPLGALQVADFLYAGAILHKDKPNE